MIDEYYQALSDDMFIFGPPRAAALSLFDEDYGDLVPNQLRVQFRQRRFEIGQLVSELMRMTPRSRRYAVRTPPYRDLVVAERLLEECAHARLEEPYKSLQMARAAGWIANQSFPEEEMMPRWTQKVKARALCQEADAQRLLRQWRNARESYRAAALAIADLPSCAEHAFFNSSLATLCEDLGELDWAVALLAQAAATLQQLKFCWGELSPQGCLSRIGFLQLKRNDPGRAMTIFTGLRVDPLRLNAEFYAKVDLGAAICLVAMGLEKEARSVLEESFPLRGQIEDREKRVLIEWLACRLRVHLGDFELAVPRLEAIYRRTVAQRKPVESCLCALDLALAYVKRDHGSIRAPGFIAEFEKIVGPAPGPWAQDALQVLREELERHADLGIAARAAANRIEPRWAFKRRRAAG